MAVITFLEGSLRFVVGLLKFCLETVAVFCIFMGLTSSIHMALRQPTRIIRSHFLLLRLRLGSWLALALEFQLGADILSTTIAPTFAELGKLGAIALIRTFLNYFISQELSDEEKRESQLRGISSASSLEQGDK